MKILIAALVALLAWFFLLAAPAGAAEMMDPLAKLQCVSTGIGAEERQAEPPVGYQAKLIFASPKGELLADVQVMIARGGRERTVMSEGPWLFLKGAPGEYEVRASSYEVLGGMKISLPAKGMRTFVIHLREPKKLQMRN